MTTQFPNLFQNFLMLIGRICLSLIFVISGFDKLMDFAQTSQAMAAKGVPYHDIMLIIAIIFELGGGILVLLGLYVRFGALLLFLFVIPVTYYFHGFWEMENIEMINNFHHFFKNLAIIGGTLYIISFGAGRISIDGLIRKK